MADIFEIIGKVSLDGLDKAKKDLKGFSSTGEQSASKLSKLGSIAGAVGKGVLVGTGAVATGAVALVKSVSGSYGQLQQSIGGIETLFGESAQKVIENANNAYTTAGISANDYMQQVTSFSASLLQSLGGDTEASANTADMAVRDMADNANKMGTSMESIQNAYQGFAKQNYTMLDNLKLGYGGTKGEMERLLADAEKISGIKYDMSNLNDVYSAIHVIQGELGITGTTAKEAGDTIEGSFNSLSASWENFIAGLGNPDADMSKLVENLAKGLSGAISNVTPIINNMVAVLPVVADSLIGAVEGLAPTFITTFTELITKVINAIVPLLPTVIPLFVDMLVKVGLAIAQNAPELIDGFIQLITQLTVSISENLPTLIPIFIECLVEIGQALIENAPIILDAILSIGSNFSEGLSPAINACIGLVEVLTGAFIAFKAGAMIQKVVQGFQSAQVALSLFKLQTQGASIAQGLMNGQLTLGETIVGLLTGKVTLAEIATGLWSKAQGVLNAVMSANPIALVVMAIGTLIAIFVVAYNKSETFRNIVDSLWGKIKEFGSQLVEWAKGIPDAITSAFNTVIDFVKNNWQGLLLLIANPFAGAFKLLYDNCDGFRNFIDNFIKNVKTVFKNGIDAIVKFFSQLPKKIGHWVGLALGKVAKWTLDVKNKAKETGKNFVNNVVNFIKQLPYKFGYWLGSVLAKTATFAIELLGKAREAGKNFVGNMVNFIKDLPSKISSTFTDVISKVVTFSSDVGKKATSVGKKIFNNIINNIKNLPSKIKDIGSDIVEGLWNGIDDMTDWIIDKIESFGEGVLDGIKDFFGIASPSKLMRDEVGKFLGQGIGVGIEEDDTAESSIKNKVDNILGIADGALSDITIGTSVDNMLFENPLQKYQIDFNAQISALNDGFDRLIALVSNYLPDIASGLDRNIVIDGNSLAVGMSRRMDEELGKMVVAKGRGNV